MQRFVLGETEDIQYQNFTDNKTNKTYWVEYFDEIVELCNKLNEEFEAEYQEVEELSKEINSLCNYIRKIESLISVDILELRKQNDVDTLIR